MIPEHLKPKDHYDPDKHGALDPGFRYADGIPAHVVWADMAAREPLSEAKRYRLVKDAKSPTAIKPPNWGAGFDPNAMYGQASLPEPQIPITPSGQRAAYAVIQYRDWSDEYRIRTRVETTSGTRPPEQAGARISDSLTPRAVRKVAESCAYVDLQKGGYRTFFTLTFDQAHREAIARGETTIQREVSRFMDGLQKMRRRGWKAEFTVNGRRIYCADTDGSPMGEGGSTGELLYVWVAEAPDNAIGEPNPHVHVLINWRVKYALFPAWAKRIETLWGQGMAHIEKIKDSEAAGAYMMKAAGYLCKAQGKTDQGEIRGNRYGISEAARAPDWATLEEKQIHIMGRLIADVYDHLSIRYGEEYQTRRRLNKALDQAPKGSRVRHIIGKQLEQVRKRLKVIPIIANKYQLIIKGKAAFWEFMTWARSPGHWRAPIDWLPEKGPGQAWEPGARPDSQWLAEFKARHYWQRALRRMPGRWTDLEFQQATNDYEEYASIISS